MALSLSSIGTKVILEAEIARKHQDESFPTDRCTKTGFRRISSPRDLQIPAVQPLLSSAHREQVFSWPRLCEPKFVLTSSSMNLVYTAVLG